MEAARRIGIKAAFRLVKPLRGKPGTDYPILGAVPYTNFYCDEQPYPGFFADMDTRCQAWHYCDIDGRQASFLCPNGTIFSQGVASCDWWFNVRCSLSPALYPLNARLYRRRKKQSRPKPHRVIDKKLIDEIFL
ncbi:jg6953 [Pararge aegeria aegeria]|uniref:Jg6953 protein n=1 Tax=Pararge aegeria aegeria TaxID=348720 RepID=A0A8S4SPR0_9NEOP|nr:jg6953 [Pararge aegeria aegeria]